LAALSDGELQALIDGGTPLEIRGRAQFVRLDVAGEPVFVKPIPLTDVERRPGNVHATANLFRLPLYYQYGIGSLGFGAWRELAVTRMASDWALSGDCEGFPLLHHWRVLPRTPPPPMSEAERERTEQAVAYWNGSAAIRARRAAVRAASASLVLFLEFVPETLDTWLKRQMAAGDEAFEAAILRSQERLDEIAAFLNDRGVLHLDLHYHNVLADSAGVRVTDFGLAIWSGFDLSPAERRFFERHRLYDRGYLAHHLGAWIDQFAAPAGLTSTVKAELERRRPVSAVMGRFITALRETSKTTPYPTAALQRAFAEMTSPAQAAG
jgi:hypothetical protein